MPSQDPELRSTTRRKAWRQMVPSRHTMVKMGSLMGTVIATPAAIDAIVQLRVAHHAVAFRASTASRDLGAPSSVIEAKLPPELNDLQLGEIGGAPFLVDADQYKRWGCPNLVVDVPQGIESPSFNGVDGIRLTIRSSR